LLWCKTLGFFSLVLASRLSFIDLYWHFFSGQTVHSALLLFACDSYHKFAWT
jgi:hypothetical protein